MLATEGPRLYAAARSGRLFAFDEDGRQRWLYDTTSDLMRPGIVTLDGTRSRTHEPERAPSDPSTVPRGANLLRNGKATLRVGGTPGWKSRGTVNITADALTNGIADDAVTPWLGPNEVFWDGIATRKVWVELELTHPGPVRALTIYENPKFPESWPRESVIQAWDEVTEQWRTVKHGTFLHSAVTTYALDLPRVRKLRYLPWSDYFRNFHTSEVELR